MAVATITELKMVIGGEWVESSSGQWMDVRSPATGELVGRVPKGTAADTQIKHVMIELTGVAEKGWHAQIFGDAAD